MRPVLLLTLVSFLAQAQTGASRLILAAVTDARGRAVVDVGADDFVVQEGATTREILSARVADYPIVVMVDTGSDARADFPLTQRAAIRFVERLGHDRPIAVGVFGEPPRMLTSFEDSRETVLERLNGMTAGGGGSQLLKGASTAAAYLRSTGTLFSSIVLLSATIFDASHGPSDELVAPIIDSSTIVHVVARRTVGSPFGVRDQTIRALVEQTRGEFTPVYSATSFPPALDRLVDRLASEMLIEYLVPPGSKPLDAKIGIRLAGTRVRGLGVAPK